MRLVNSRSLAGTLDALNEAFFHERFLWKQERYEAAQWLTGRQGLPGAYADTFAPTQQDLKGGIRLFTGERVTTRAGTAHVLGEEGCRALILLKAPIVEVHNALNHATHGLLERLTEADELNSGVYCCPTCTCALWRHLAVGGLVDGSPERWLKAGMNALKTRRTAAGKWKGFPFHYALLALTELDLPAAVDEIRHAAPACERFLASPEKEGDKYDARCRLVAKRALAKC